MRVGTNGGTILIQISMQFERGKDICEVCVFISAEREIVIEECMAEKVNYTNQVMHNLCCLCKIFLTICQ